MAEQADEKGKRIQVRGKFLSVILCAFLSAPLSAEEVTVRPPDVTGSQIVEEANIYKDISGAGYGGVFNVSSGGALTFNAAETFLNNSSTVAGGAIYNASDATINFAGASYAFKDNTANGVLNDIHNDGVMRVGAAGKTTDFYASYVTGAGTTNIVSRATVNLNAAEGEDAINWQGIYNSGTLNINNDITISDMERLNPNYDGGAISNWSAITFNGSASFLNNEVSRSGGAILNFSSLSFNADAEFIGNTAGFWGGAIYNASGATLSLNTKADFVGNTARSTGGAILNKGTLDLSGVSEFTGNKAGSAGGAIYNEAGAITFNGNAEFIGNTAGINGGAIYNAAVATINFAGASYTFKDNTANGVLNDIHNDGVMYVGATGKTTDFNASYVTGSGATNIVSGATVNLNAANATEADAGTIDWTNHVDVKRSAILNVKGNATFAGINHTASGGAIYNEGNVILHGDVLFESNNTGLYGGAIRNENGSVFTINGFATFKDNTATGGNAAISNRLATMVLNGGGLFEGNQTAKNGGSAIANSGSVTLNAPADSSVKYIFRNNTAAGRGGAVNNIQGGSFLTFNGDADFIGNAAGINGGAIYNASGMTLNFAGASYTFKDNTANGVLNDIHNDGVMNIGAAGKTTDFYASYVTGSGTTNIVSGATVNLNAANAAEADAGTIDWTNHVDVATSAILNVKGNATFAGINHTASGGAIYNAAGATINFADALYTFKDNTANGVLNDIHNDGIMNIGAAGKTTDFNISHVSNSQVQNIAAQTNFFGTVNLKATNDAGLIDFKNRMVLTNGTILNVLSDITVTGYTKDMASNEYGGGIRMNGGVFTALGNVTIKDNFVNGQGGGILMNSGTMTLGSAGKTVRFENNFSYYGGAVKLVGGTLNIDGKAEFVNNSTGQGSAVYLQYSTLNLNDDALFENNPSSTAAIYNLSGKVNFNGSSYTFKNNAVGDSFGDIYNNGTMVIGKEASDTAFTISFVDGSGTSEFTGGRINLNAASGNKILWKNHVTVTAGATLNIGHNLLDMGDKTFVQTSTGTLKLSISGLTEGLSDYTGGQFITTGAAILGGGALSVTIDPTVSLIGKTGELTLISAGMYSGSYQSENLSISDGYTIEYVGDGKFVISSARQPDPPAPTPDTPEDTEFVKPAKEVAVSDVRAGVSQISDRLSVLSSMSAPVTASSSPASDKGRSGGSDAGDGVSVWAKALYTTTDLRGKTHMNSDGYGGIVGIDGLVGLRTILGAALGYTRNDGDTDASHFKSATYLGYLYGRYALTEKSGVTGTVGYGFSRFDLSAASEKFNAHTINVQASYERVLPLSLTAEIGGRYTFGKMDSYMTGTTRVKAEDTHTGTAFAGLRYRRGFNGFLVKAGAGALYDVYSERSDYRISQSGAASVLSRGERLHRFGVEGGVGIGYAGRRWGVEADYNAQVRKDYNDQTISVKLAYKFGVPSARKTGKAIAASMTTVAPAAAVVPPAAPGGARGTTLQGKSQSAPVKRLQISSFKKEQNARRQYRNLSKKYPELRAKKPEYEHVNVKGKGKRVRTYVKGKDEELQTLCKKMHGDLKDTCLIKKGK